MPIILVCASIILPLVPSTEVTSAYDVRAPFLYHRTAIDINFLKLHQSECHTAQRFFMMFMLLVSKPWKIFFTRVLEPIPKAVY